MGMARTTIERLLGAADVEIGGDRSWDIEVHNAALFQRVLTMGGLGFGEAYMDGWWDCDALDELFCRLLQSKLDTVHIGGMKARLFELAGRVLNLQTIGRSKAVANLHYNMDNALFASMLGKTMAYTCGYWENHDSLDAAQDAKHDLICRKLKLSASDHVLELGCGWGAFAKFAATHYGCRISAVNIATQQVAFAKEYCAGLPVTLYCADYRDHSIYNPKGHVFDKVVSVGLCEHIGWKNYAEFSALVASQLHPEGLFLLHTIGSDLSVTRVNAWTDKYIFPNGMLPSMVQLCRAFEEHFIIEDWHNFGADYDPTLMAWLRNFETSWPDHRKKYDDVFYRMWRYYLTSSAGFFRAHRGQLWHAVLSRCGSKAGYRSLR